MLSKFEGLSNPSDYMTVAKLKVVEIPQYKLT